MGYRNREIEVKYLAVGANNMSRVSSETQLLLGNNCERILRGYGVDTYWPDTSGQNKYDFIRLRDIEDGTAQITLKHKDKGDPVDRVEIDVPVKDPAAAMKFLIKVFGQPIGKIGKKYDVYFLENEHTTVSVYQVRGDKRVFVEVEAMSRGRVKTITEMLAKLPWDLVPTGASLYEMFLEPKQAPKKKAAKRKKLKS